MLAEETGAALVMHDRYYRDADAHTNFDHPDALETSALVGHLDQLRRGAAVELPRYHFPTHKRLPTTDILEPRPLLVVEGILVLADAELRRRFDLAVFVRAAADVRLIRRLRRDVAERGRTVDSVLDQYLSTVRPMHETFVEPSAAHAGLVLDGEGDLTRELGKLRSALPARLRGA
jgi:uridine kinase